MALQRTRRPRLRSGRSLRSLGSPLNARSLGRLAQRTLGLAVLLVMGIPAAVSLADSSLVMVSEPGDFVGEGRTFRYDLSNATWQTNVYPDNHVYVALQALKPSSDFDEFWFLNFAAPDSGRLVAGSYPNAVLYPSNPPGIPGLSVTSLNGCSSITGSFSVLQATYHPDGQVDSLWVTFEQHCEGGKSVLSGELRINVEIAAVPVLGWIAKGLFVVIIAISGFAMLSRLQL